MQRTEAAFPRVEKRASPIVRFARSPRSLLHQDTDRPRRSDRFYFCSLSVGLTLERICHKISANVLPATCVIRMASGRGLLLRFPFWGVICLASELTSRLSWPSCWLNPCLLPYLPCPFHHFCPVRSFVLLSVLVPPFFILPSQWWETSSWQVLLTK